MSNPNPNPSSTALIRFPDCDPFNHLNNSRYLDYLINAREDHVRENYGLDLYQYAATRGQAWVVATNHIAYLRPAMLMETVVIESMLTAWDEFSVQVELKMWDKGRTQLKCLLWSRFVHIDLKSGKRTPHPADMMELFGKVHVPFEQEMSFEERVKALR